MSDENNLSQMFCMKCDKLTNFVCHAWLLRDHCICEVCGVKRIL